MRRGARTPGAATAPGGTTTSAATRPPTATTPGLDRRPAVVGPACWSVGLVGRATPALAAASTCDCSVRACCTHVGGSSIYDVVYEGQSIEIERLWVSNNVGAGGSG